MDLPYITEYAKSSRAKCKSCKLTIEKECLRLGVMVQSAFHDGKQANWFHMNCFFLKQRPKTIGDIQNFEKLRNEDQKLIEENVDKISSSGIALPSTRKTKGKKRENENSSDGHKDFSVEYSKSGRAHCVGCQLKIAKDDIRICKMNYETDIGMKYGGQAMWHHLQCFVTLRDECGFFDAGTKLPGYKSLSGDDQKKVKEVLPVKQVDVHKIKKLKMEPKDETDLAQDAAENQIIKNQNEILYKYRDKLKTLDKKELVKILENNHQKPPIGIDNILDAVADILTFGALLPCPKCKGQFELAKGGYMCQGDFSEWVKCLTLVKEPPRKLCKIEEKLKQKYDFLSNYKCQISNRVIKYVASTVPNKKIKKEEGFEEGPRVKREKPKLYNMEFVIFGKTKYSKTKLTDIVVKFGGTIKTKLTSQTAAVISNPTEIKKMGSRMSEIKNLGIHVVDDSYFDELEMGDAIKLLSTKTICDWGTDPLLRFSQEEKPRESMYTKNMPTKMLIKLKDGGAVDPASNLQDQAHIYENNGVKYNCILSRTEIQSGKNSYYKMQILKSDIGTKFWLFRSWGRIGTKIGSTKLENTSLFTAIELFNEFYLEKTGNRFGSTNFVKRPGCYIPIDIDYSDNKVNDLNEISNIKSTLDKKTESLIKLLFDIDMMKKTLLEFELDTVKMPLGKLSRKQIESAYTVLTKLSNLITSDGSESDFIANSNQFYSLIPHACGLELPPILDTTEMIKNKTEMLDSMMEIELAYKLLSLEVDDSMNPVDAHYAQLNTEMTPLDPKSTEFEMILKYVKTTHAETHKSFELEVVDIFKVKRKGEERRYKPFKKFHNRKLLWHGSRLTNYVGILSHGLKIAPPEAPSTGYMFGKGIYFADMVSKSANYCCTNHSNSTGLMLLCEVALGDMLECKSSKYVTKLPKDKHSTKGIGQTSPDPAGSYIRTDGVEIPYGKPITVKKDSSLLYNEYIVYDVAQVNVQYLLKINFNYK